MAVNQIRDGNLCAVHRAKLHGGHLRRHGVIGDEVERKRIGLHLEQQLHDAVLAAGRQSAPCCPSQTAVEGSRDGETPALGCVALAVAEQALRVGTFAGGSDLWPAEDQRLLVQDAAQHEDSHEDGGQGVGFGSHSQRVMLLLL